MGQHKTNPTAILAAQGKLPPKPTRMGQKEMNKAVYAELQKRLAFDMNKAIGTAIRKDYGVI